MREFLSILAFLAIVVLMYRPYWSRKKYPRDGVCCGCGYTGHEETNCPGRDDGIHCVHWWDGNDDKER